MDDNSGVNISRSGRIRKKSSKLADFDSDDILDNSMVNNPNNSSSTTTLASSTSATSAPSISALAKSKKKQTEIKSVGQNEMDEVVNFSEEDLLALPTLVELEMDEDEDGALKIDDSRGSRKVYSKKRSLPAANAPISPYLLWAKTTLPKLRQQPGNYRSHTELQQKLKELWTKKIPSSEREIWRKRALKWTDKIPQAHLAKKAKLSGISNPSSSISSITSPPSPLSRQSVVSRLSTVKSPTMTSTPNREVANFKIVGTEPLDAAAHLKLLGESLSVIGKRLTEHQGQIAVSGSLSVLLDSLLCAMGPLVCLTNQVPELNNSVPQDTLEKILDNVAYIMPGL